MRSKRPEDTPQVQQHGYILFKSILLIINESLFNLFDEFACYCGSKGIRFV